MSIFFFSGLHEMSEVLTCFGTAVWSTESRIDPHFAKWVLMSQSVWKWVLPSLLMSLFIKRFPCALFPKCFYIQYPVFGTLYLTFSLLNCLFFFLLRESSYWFKGMLWYHIFTGIRKVTNFMSPGFQNITLNVTVVNNVL